MRSRTLATAASILLTMTACGADASDEAEGTGGEQAQTRTEEPSVPVERSTDLVDPEGSVLGTAWLRDSTGGDVAELEVQAAGLTEGFHGMQLYAVDSCEAVTPEAPSTLLPPVLVLPNGLGSMTTLVGPVDLDQLVGGEGVTLVIGETAEEPAQSMAGDTGSSVACAAFAE